VRGSRPQRMTSLIRFGCVATLLVTLHIGVFGQVADPLSELLQGQQRDLATEGEQFLVTEGSRAAFVVVGGLHGDRETPALVETLVRGLQPSGYHHMAAEISPWAASHRSSARGDAGQGVQIHGADIEEPRPDLLIRDLAAMNPQSRALREMVDITKTGYGRETAGQLLQLARDAGELKDAPAGGVPLYTLLLETLEVESTRAAKRRFDASTLREAFMKAFFIGHYRAASRGNASPKFLVVFGQSHSGRGIDRRGVSTLGNFVSELAVAEGAHSFHVLLFAAGGKYSLQGLHEIDQRQDDPAFAFLASLARHSATVFDLRPTRPLLHVLPAPLAPRDASLLYWADAYDAVICYREVTPVDTPPTPQ
jgi:hypothetical protein